MKQLVSKNGLWFDETSSYVRFKDTKNRTHNASGVALEILYNTEEQIDQQSGNISDRIFSLDGMVIVIISCVYDELTGEIVEIFTI